MAMGKFSFLLFLCFTLTISLSYGADTISANQSLTGNQTLISSGGNFELGLFNPGNSSNCYIGMWYKKISVQTIVWVANRETPISDNTTAELKVIDGNLVILSGSPKTQIWSTNVNPSTAISRSAVLRDDGNLVLIDGSNSNSNSTTPIWQSFDNPANTWLPGSKIGYNKRTRTKQLLTSWKNTEDPALGLFSLELDPNGSQYLIKWNRSDEYWTSGAWNGEIFSLAPEMSLNYYISNDSYIDNENETYFMYSVYNPAIISRFIMDVSGQIKQLGWLETSEEWNLLWSQPRQLCEVYAYCGAFGICNQSSLPFCNCLDGFTPSNDTDWGLNDYSRGCVRKKDLQCGNVSVSNGERNRFLMKSQMSLPQHPQSVGVGSVRECEEACLNNCSCTAYAYDNNACSIWIGELMNLKQLSDDDGIGKTIHIRLSSSEFSGWKSSKWIVIGSVVGSVVGVAVLLGLVWFVMKRRQKRMVGNMISESRKGIKGNTVLGLYRPPRQFSEEDKQNIDVPFFDLETILAATAFFSDANKLGQGGFGPVYKGMFPGGQEIAVKRLSVHSMQGLEELKNEVVLIAKLQHRNLVRLLGYCIEGEENILLYEYMPNKSLDAFIFDQTLCVLLDWEKRFEIVLGIARGLLYLHQDSRLRVIHRDLKASNILLDEDMNPKISDFGLARIVGGRETEANTNRIAGTYGYMSPEYALDGLFSIKSDVFSFGVVVLEIISGKKNTGFYKAQHDLNLLGYALEIVGRRKANGYGGPDNS